VLAVTGSTRLGLLPDVPTVAESGLPGFEAVLRYGLLVPAGTPRPIVERLNRELRTLVGADDVKARVAREGGVTLVSSPQEYAAEIAREDALWGPLIRGLNIKVNQGLGEPRLMRESHEARSTCTWPTWPGARPASPDCIRSRTPASDTNFAIASLRAFLAALSWPLSSSVDSLRLSRRRIAAFA
jgi:hypothetical protein